MHLQIGVEEVAIGAGITSSYDTYYSFVQLIIYIYYLARTNHGRECTVMTWNMI
jgi:hypothetical protein